MLCFLLRANTKIFLSLGFLFLYKILFIVAIQLNVMYVSYLLSRFFGYQSLQLYCKQTYQRQYSKVLNLHRSGLYIQCIIQYLTNRLILKQLSTVMVSQKDCGKNSMSSALLIYQTETWLKRKVWWLIFTRCFLINEEKFRHSNLCRNSFLIFVFLKTINWFILFVFQKSPILFFIFVAF